MRKKERRNRGREREIAEEREREREVEEERGERLKKGNGKEFTIVVTYSDCTKDGKEIKRGKREREREKERKGKREE